MKKIYFIIAIFLLFYSATKVNAVTGTIPKLQPLQPIPENSFPNLSKNIHFETEILESADGNSENSEQKKISSEANVKELAPKNYKAWFSKSNILNTENSILKHFIFGIFLIVVFVGSIYYVKRGK